MNKKPQKPKVEKPTPKQKKILIATVLTDGWIELQEKGKNPRIGLQLREASIDLLNVWLKEMRSLCTEKTVPKLVKKAPPKKSDDVEPEFFDQYMVRTRCNPAFHEIFSEFGFSVETKSDKSIKKTVPSIQYLKEYLDYEALAWMLMFDGSKKSDHGRQIEIHLQSFSQEALIRLCVVLYYKLGINAWPSYYGKSKNQEDQYHIQISGFSLPTVLEKVKPFMLKSFHYKLPTMSSEREYSEANSPWPEFYKKNIEPFKNLFKLI